MIRLANSYFKMKNFVYIFFLRLLFFIITKIIIILKIIIIVKIFFEGFC